MLYRQLNNECKFLLDSLENAIQTADIIIQLSDKILCEDTFDNNTNRDFYIRSKFEGIVFYLDVVKSKLIESISFLNEVDLTFLENLNDKDFKIPDNIIRFPLDNNDEQWVDTSFNIKEIFKEKSDE